ncbi:MAG: hypothetical protein IJ274_14045 [Lachnospiraceae bacterium]|nr:hypothetical protein [Lachnospiraceae bacterium]
MKKWCYVVGILVIALFTWIGYQSDQGGIIGLVTMQNLDYPDSGSYYSAEQNVTIRFEEDGTYLTYKDGKEQLVYIDYGNNLFSDDHVLRGSIFWNQKRDIVRLEIKQGNDYLQQDMTIKFEKADNTGN